MPTCYASPGVEQAMLGYSHLSVVPFVIVENNPSLIAFHMVGTERIESDLIVSGNANLEHINADALDVVAHLLVITNNPNYPQSKGLALLAQLSENYAANIVGNKP